MLTQRLEHLKIWLLVLLGNALIGSLFGLGMGHGLRTLVQHASTANWELAWNGLLFFIVVLVIENVHKIFNPLLITKFNLDIQTSLRRLVLNNAFQNNSVLKQERGDYLETIITDVQKITSLLVQLIVHFVEYPVVATTTIVYLILSSNFIMLILGVVVSVFSWLIARRFSSYLTEVSKSERKVNGIFMQFVKECFTNIAMFKFQKPFNWIDQQNDHFNQDLIDLKVKKQKYLIMSNILQDDVANTFARLSVMVVGGILVFRGIANAGDLVAFVFLFHRIVKPFQNMFDFFNKLNAQLGSLEKVLKYTEIYEKVSPVERKMIKNVEKIKFKNFELYVKDRFLYKIDELQLSKGSITCIKGANGTGKTTLIHSLLGHHNEYSGSILINNLDISHELAQYRDLFSVSSQESFLFTESIKENITLGNEPVGYIEKLDKVIKACGLLKALEQDRLDLEQIVNNNLSSGQKKLITLCRALYWGAPVIILDEPTESLDFENVQNLKSILKDIQDHHIIIIVTHDESLVNFADQTFCIDENAGIGGIVA